MYSPFQILPVNFKFLGQNISESKTCKNFVTSALRYHNSCKTNNGDVCLMGKYHNLLYIAMKLTFDWSLQDNGVVAALLDEMYACEGTFERIFLGKTFFMNLLPHRELIIHSRPNTTVTIPRRGSSYAFFGSSFRLFYI